jgi:hypothetical protein
MIAGFPDLAEAPAPTWNEHPLLLSCTTTRGGKRPKQTGQKLFFIFIAFFSQHG